MRWISIWRLPAANIFVVASFLLVQPASSQTSRDDMVCSHLIPAQPDERVAACTAVIKETGDVQKLSVTYCNRGTAFQDRGFKDRALADFDEAVKLDPNGVEGHLCRGFGNITRNAFSAAIADFFDNAIELNPNSSPAFVGRGLAYRAKGDLDRAIGDYNEAIRLDPTSVVAFNDRGIVLLYQRKYDLAIDDFSNAIRLDSMTLERL